MNIRDLRYFTVLVDERSFTKAAQRCGVSQPTLSTQIRKLEEKIGATLVERSTQGVILTPVGQEILEYARIIIDNAGAIQRFADRARDPRSGTFTLGLFPTLGPYLLPRIMGRIQEEYPNMTLRLMEEKTEVLEEMLLRGEIDGIVVAKNPLDERLTATELFNEDFVFASHAEHPLVKLGRDITMEDLESTELLFLNDGHCMAAQSLEICHRAQAKQMDFRASSFPVLQHMVAAGFGATLLPRLCALSQKQIPAGLQITEFSAPVPKRTLYFVMRKSSPLTEIGGELQKLIKEVAPQASRNLEDL